MPGAKKLKVSKNADVEYTPQRNLYVRMPYVEYTPQCDLCLRPR